MDSKNLQPATCPRQTIENLALRNLRRAKEIIADTGIEAIWRSVGDFHVYSNPVVIADSFAAMAKLAEHPAIRRVECINSLDTDEHCIEWHAYYLDREGDEWQIDMIHILGGSRYDGFFERMAERITQVLTPETRGTILRLKHETPDDEKIMGVEYYQAVLRDGVRTYTDFMNWRKRHPVTGVVEWIP